MATLYAVDFKGRQNFGEGQDIEKRIGLLRCYISRVENGHTVPAVETLEKMARALEVPFHQLFYDGEEPPSFSISPRASPPMTLPGADPGKRPVS